MRRVRLGSSAITAVKYDAENRTLESSFESDIRIGICMCRSLFIANC